MAAVLHVRLWRHGKHAIHLLGVVRSRRHLMMADIFFNLKQQASNCNMVR